MVPLNCSGCTACFSATAIKNAKRIDAVELIVIETEIGYEKFSTGEFDLATKLFKDMITKNDFDEFLTLPAYKYI